MYMPTDICKELQCNGSESMELTKNRREKKRKRNWVKRQYKMNGNEKPQMQLIDAQPNIRWQFATCAHSHKEVPP